MCRARGCRVFGRHWVAVRCFSVWRQAGDGVSATGHSDTGRGFCAPSMSRARSLTFEGMVSMWCGVVLLHASQRYGHTLRLILFWIVPDSFRTKQTPTTGCVQHLDCGTLSEIMDFLRFVSRTCIGSECCRRTTRNARKLDGFSFSW